MPRTVPVISKYAAEILDQSMDFSNVLDGGESIASGEVTAVSGDGALTIASVSTSSPSISYRLSGGTVGTMYFVDVAATLNSGEIVIQRVYYEIKTP